VAGDEREAVFGCERKASQQLTIAAFLGFRTAAIC
jgi:hypothetical protein